MDTKVNLALLGGLAIVLVAAAGPRSRAASTTNDPEFRAFLGRFEEGIRRFVNGDAGLWKEHASHRDDVTIMGGWGAYERGWKEQVAARYEWAAARFQDGDASPTFEYVSSAVSGDLAYTVTIERGDVRVVGQDRPAAMALRVTQVFRREDGSWKLVHRHADPLIAKTAPAAVLEQ